MNDLLHKNANKRAETHPFFERHRQLSGSSFVRGLVFGWIANPQASLDGLSQSIGNAGTPITRQGLHQRFTKQGANYLYGVLRDVLEGVVSAMPVEEGLLSRFSHVYLLDSTQIELPADLAQRWTGCGGLQGESAAMKVNVRWDVRTGELEQLDFSNGSQHDGKSIIQDKSLPEGSLRIADLGYFNLNVLARTSAQGAYWLTRYKTTTGVYDERGCEIDLAQALPEVTGQQVDWAVSIGKQARLSCRLVAERLPDEIVQQRRDRLERTARQAQRPLSARAYELAQWTIYLTNVPNEQLKFEEILILGRYRWQIELLFKLWKSELQIDKWKSNNPHRILCELYAKLIGVIVTHWLLLVGTWDNPQRSLTRSMSTIRGLAWQFANCIPKPLFMNHVLRALKRSLRACRLEQSQSFTPSCKLVGMA